MVRTVFAVSALVAEICTPSPDLVRGEVALTDSPFCEFLVVATTGRFALLDWTGGLYVIAEGDQLTGPMTTLGAQVVVFDGVLGGEMRVQVQEVGVSLARAQQSYYAHCHNKKSNDPPIVLSAPLSDQ